MARRSRARRRRSLLPFVLTLGAILSLLEAAAVVRGGGAAAVAVAPTDEQRLFIGQVGGVARRLRREVGLAPSLVTAMAINESGWGQSGLSRRAHNYFGIKAEPGQGVLEPTWEVIDGRRVNIWARFRVYRSLEDSVRDLGLFLHANPRYDPVWPRADNPRLAARALLGAGYATDPEWADKLIRLIDSYKLDALDELAPAAVLVGGQRVQ